ncbi:MAG: hypothetical protein FWD53_02240 [Phycisphaerales bacterium]|nr:hypothetical protein [Phycisphaerales bacterium]
MAVVVRRHWAWLASIPIMVIAVFLGVEQWRSPQVQAQANPPPAVSVEGGQGGGPSAEALAAKRVYEKVQSLRLELALGSQDLSALGVSMGSAQQILSAIKSFAESSVEAMAAADAAEQAAYRHLAEAQRKVNVGPRDEGVLSSIPTLREHYLSAKAQRGAVLGDLVNQVNGLLTTDQRAMWHAARSSSVDGVAAPGQFRYVAGLTGEQVRQLDLLARREGASGLQTAASRVLSGGQMSQAQQALTNMQVSASAVALAERQVLPLLNQHVSE